jgi:predicted RNA-binding protein with TRAM domain
VTVQQGDTTATVPVETGLTSNGKTEIVSSGGNGVAALKAGDVVVVPSTSTTSNTSSTANTPSSLGSLTGGPPSSGPAGP